jgi:hypothetical protein
MLIHLDTIRIATSRPHHQLKSIGFGLSGQHNSEENVWIAQKRCQKTYFFRQDRKIRENYRQRGAAGAGLDCFPVFSERDG